MSKENLGFEESLSYGKQRKELVNWVQAAYTLSCFPNVDDLTTYLSQNSILYSLLQEQLNMI